MDLILFGYHFDSVFIKMVDGREFAVSSTLCVR
jgi:hypothetical protein